MRTKNKYLIIFLFANIFVFSQENLKSKNLILTVSVKSNVSKTTNTFYWLIPVDSIDIIKNTYSIYPLYLSCDISNDNLIECIDGKTVNLFVYTTKSNWDYPKDYLQNENHLRSILSKNNYIVQRIVKKKESPSKVKIKIFVTPIEGNFKYCFPTNEMKKRFDLKDQIAIPISEFKYLPELLQSENVIEFLLFKDFSKYSISNRAE